MAQTVSEMQYPAVNIPFNFTDTTTKLSMGLVFHEKHFYINEMMLFVAHFNYIPCMISEDRIDCKNAIKWFTNNFSKEIQHHYFLKRCYNESKEAVMDDAFYFIHDDLLIDFDTNHSIVRFLFKKTDLSLVENLVAQIHRFKYRKTKAKSYVSLLVNTVHGIDTTTLEISQPKLNIEDNYNHDFNEIHQIILKRLAKKNDKGLVLLHGKPGTGKTTYIRYLVSRLKKNVIMLPPNMAAAIANPELISVLINNPNSIFVIEDAEKIIKDREQEGNSPVSTLLNLTDGLLSDCLNIQVICSFNTDITKVDSALLRKGRLIAKYEFKELATEKAQMLSNKLGFETEFDSPMTLAAIYNQDEKDFGAIRKAARVGFKTMGLN